MTTSFTTTSSSSLTATMTTTSSSSTTYDGTWARYGVKPRMRSQVLLGDGGLYGASLWHLRER